MASATAGVTRTATPGTDVTAVTGTLNWADGDTEPNEAYVPVADDGAEDDREAFIVTLHAPSAGAILGSTSEAIVTISDFAEPVLFVGNLETIGDENLGQGFVLGQACAPSNHGGFSSPPGHGPPGRSCFPRSLFWVRSGRDVAPSTRTCVPAVFRVSLG